jgi:hypothetical protein
MNGAEVARLLRSIPELLARVEKLEKAVEEMNKKKTLSLPAKNAQRA